MRKAVEEAMKKMENPKGSSNKSSFSASTNQPPPAMAKLLDFLKTALLGGTLVVLPGWLAALALFKALAQPASPIRSIL
jgi:hypothetical protein